MFSDLSFCFSSFFFCCYFQEFALVLLNRLRPDFLICVYKLAVFRFAAAHSGLLLCIWIYSCAFGLAGVFKFYYYYFFFLHCCCVCGVSITYFWSIVYTFDVIYDLLLCIQICSCIFALLVCLPICTLVHEIALLQIQTQICRHVFFLICSSVDAVAVEFFAFAGAFTTLKIRICCVLWLCFWIFLICSRILYLLVVFMAF